MTPLVVMVGTDPAGRGGVAAVLRTWKQCGLFERWNVRYIVTHGNGGFVAKTRRALSALTRFAVLLVTSPVALVHVHTSSYMSFWRKTPFLALALLRGRPLVISLHGGAFREFYARSGRLARAWIRLVMRRAACFLVLSEQWRQWAQRTEPRVRVALIPNPAPELPAEVIAAQATPPVVLFLGRIEREKGLFDLLDAFAGVAAACRGAKLVCGGEGEIAAARAHAAALGIADAVVFAGWLDAVAKQQWLGRASLLVLPSYAENLPVSILEAYAHGRPVVATRVGGVADLVCDGREGLLVQPGDISRLRAALIWLLTDETLRLAMGRCARRKAEAVYAPDRVVAEIDRLYRSIIDTGAYDVAPAAARVSGEPGP